MRDNFTTWKKMLRQVVTLAVSVPWLAACSAYASVTVEWKNERLSVAADKVPLAQILREIAQRVGMEIRGGEELQEQVSVCFADLPLDDGLQKLALNYLVLWKPAPPDGQRLALAVVSAWKRPLPPQPCAFQMAAKATVATPTQSTLPARQESTADEKSNVRAAASALLTGGDTQEAIAALIEGASSERAKIRLEALRTLSQSDHVGEDIVLSALQTALTDEDEEVRGYAGQILKEREALRGDES
jgi:hypothetical protein